MKYVVVMKTDCHGKAQFDVYEFNTQECRFACLGVGRKLFGLYDTPEQANGERSRLEQEWFEETRQRFDDEDQEVVCQKRTEYLRLFVWHDTAYGVTFALAHHVTEAIAEVNKLEMGQWVCGIRVDGVRPVVYDAPVGFVVVKE